MTSAAIPTANAPVATGKPTQHDGRWIWEQSYPDDVKWHAEVPVARLDKLLDDAVAQHGKLTAIDFMGRTWTYAALGKLVNDVAGALQKRGVKRGVKVGLLLPNTIYSVVFYFATLKAGGTVVNYNPLYIEKELQGQMEDSGTDIMVTVDLALTVDKMAELLDIPSLKKLIICPFAAGLPFPKNLLFPLVKRKDVAKPPRHAKVETWSDVLRDAAKPTPVTIDPHNDIAVLQYTGGTTGIPKGAALTHANVYANVHQAKYWMTGAKAGEDSMLGVLPFFHVFAMTVVMNWTLANGMKIIMQPKFDINEVFKIIDKDRPSFFPAVPAIFNAIANHADVGKYDFSCLKFCISGGAPLPIDVKRLFEEKTGSYAIAEGYGLTEASPIVTCNPAGRNKNGSIGLPLPQTIVEILSREDGKTILPTGELGEVCVRGPQVMQGYYNKKEETDLVLKDGRLHTGDVGYIDDEGYVYIVDRIKDLIIVRGYNVYPRVVEEALYLHPAVEECIVAGVPDAERGETVHAWVKPAKGQTVTEAELMAFVKDKLNPIEEPRKIIVRDQPLPKTTVGKLSRKDLLIQEGIKK